MLLAESDLQKSKRIGSDDVMTDAPIKNHKVKKHVQEIDGWQYYNHAMIPSSAPHEAVDLSAVRNGEIWHYRNGKDRPLLVRWTTDWDCDHDTGWWFVVREGPFDLKDLSSSSRRNIRKSLRNCRAEKINPAEHTDDLWRVFNEAVERYRNYRITVTKQEFVNKIIGSETEREYWGGFDNQTGRMIGYAIFQPHQDWVEFLVSKYSSRYLKLRVSDAINAKALDYYLNQLKKRYISDGARSIFHKTSFQNYLRNHFGYRHAFCRLHVLYRKPVKLLIDLLYPFRSVLRRFDDVRAIQQMNSLLFMEEIIRSESKETIADGCGPQRQL